MPSFCGLCDLAQPSAQNTQWPSGLCREYVRVFMSTLLSECLGLARQDEMHLVLVEDVIRWMLLARFEAVNIERIYHLGDFKLSMYH